MARRNVYTIYYKKHRASEIEEQYVIAGSQAEAYNTFMDRRNWSIYSAWVHSVTYQNGKYHVFAKNFEGNPY